MSFVALRWSLPAALLRRARPGALITAILSAALMLPLTHAQASTAPRAAAVARPASSLEVVFGVLHDESAATAHLIRASRFIKPMSNRGIARFGHRVLREAARHAGRPYAYGANGPYAFDCSGFTRYVFRTQGVDLPRTSYEQYAVTRHIPRSAARPGDLLFLGGLGHVGIYAGGDMMWDAPTSGGQVRERPIYGSYLVGRVVRKH